MAKKVYSGPSFTTNMGRAGSFQWIEPHLAEHSESFRTVRIERLLSPCQSLLFACLVDALICVNKPPTVKTELSRAQLQRDTRAWFISDRMYYGSFLFICETLELDVGIVRQAALSHNKVTHNSTRYRRTAAWGRSKRDPENYITRMRNAIRTQRKDK